MLVGWLRARSVDRSASVYHQAVLYGRQERIAPNTSLNSSAIARVMSISGGQCNFARTQSHDCCIMARLDSIARARLVAD